MRLFVAFFVLFLLACPLPAQAKDSLDYMEDGEMTQEEMEEEAAFVAEKCFRHSIKNKYYDCACIGGKFLIERENRGPFALQADIEYDIFRQPGCPNRPAIAGMMYEDCETYAAFMRRHDGNYKNYCECVANTMADSFGEFPSLNSRHLQRLRTSAMVQCNYQGR